MEHEKPTYQKLEEELSILKKKIEVFESSEISYNIVEAKYKNMIANIGDVIGIIGNDGIIKYVSPNVEKFFGWKPEELIGSDGLSTVHREELECMRNGFLALYEKDNELINVEYRFRCKDGSYKWIELIAVNNISNADINGILINYHDITDRKRAEHAIQESQLQLKARNEKYIQLNKELQEKNNEYAALNEEYKTQNENIQKAKENAEESEALLKNITDNIPAYIAAVDINTLKYTFINKKFEKSLKKSCDEIVGKHIAEVIGQDNYIIAKHYIDIVRRGQSASYINTLHLAEGKQYINVNYTPGYDTNGKMNNILVLSLDVTEIKQKEDELLKAKEKAEESDRLKSAFLANMSHEIRTPMNGILGFADLLKNTDLSGDLHYKYLEIIENSGIRMLNIINDIISISKIESGLMELNIERTNINEQQEYIYTFFKPEIEEKGIRFSFRNSLPATDVTIKTDQEKLLSVLTNLVKNSLKYTTEGSIEFGYNLKGEFLEFYVKDTGIGIRMDRQEAIFERFIQADIADTMARQGAGLGLSISKAYAEMLGGTIWVESEKGGGSTFYFTIRYEPVTKEQAVDENKDDSPGEMSAMNKLKILIAEDDTVSEMLLSVMVRKFGEEIISVKNGKDAVGACRNNPDIDLVLMDIQMPEMNGYDATRKIREFNKEIIIIAQTAYAMEGDINKALEAGCNDHIAKPVLADELERKIIKYM